MSQVSRLNLQEFKDLESFFHLHLEDLFEMSIKAGDVIMSYFTPELEINYKKDGSRVTIADQKAEDLILPLLKKISDFPIISEEYQDKTPFQNTDISGDYFWLVDPLDGTRQFTEQIPEFTVNIALIHKNKPIFGLIYLPPTKELFYTYKGKAYKQDLSISPPTPQLLTLNSKEDLSQNLNIVTGRTSHYKNIIDQIHLSYPQATYQQIGSSIKFCRVAEGKFDYYFKFGQTKEWDTAAGQAILEAAGGEVIDLKLTELTYRKDRFENPFYIAKAKKDQRLHISDLLQKNIIKS